MFGGNGSDLKSPRCSWLKQTCCCCQLPSSRDFACTSPKLWLLLRLLHTHDLIRAAAILSGLLCMREFNFSYHISEIVLCNFHIPHSGNTT